jgi:hypothetical protein
MPISPGQNDGLSFNGLTYERPLLLAHTEAPVAIDALFVNIEYGPAPEHDWKR